MDEYMVANKNKIAYNKKLKIYFEQMYSEI